MKFKIMRAWIELSPNYSQQIMQTAVFQAEFGFTYNEEGLINGIFKDNEVVNNDEQTFRAQILNRIKDIFLQVNGVDFNTIEIVHEEESGNPLQLRWLTNPNPNQRQIAQITEVEEVQE